MVDISVTKTLGLTVSGVVVSSFVQDRASTFPATRFQQSGAPETRAAAAAAIVRVGPVQHLEFVEEGDETLQAPDEYDGHHICIYLSEEGWFNPRSWACWIN